MGPAVSPDGKRLYVCNRFDNDVSVIDLAAGKELARVAAVREPIAAAVTPDGRTVLVANHLPNTRTDAALRGRRGGRGHASSTRERSRPPRSRCRTAPTACAACASRPTASTPS